MRSIWQTAAAKVGHPEPEPEPGPSPNSICQTATPKVGHRIRVALSPSPSPSPSRQVGRMLHDTAGRLHTLFAECELMCREQERHDQPTAAGDEGWLPDRGGGGGGGGVRAASRARLPADRVRSAQSMLAASLQAAASQMVAALCRGLERLLAEGGAVAREVGLAGSSDTIASYARRAEKSETLNL